MGEYILQSKREQMLPSMPIGKIDDLSRRVLALENGGGWSSNSFETVLRNLKSYPGAISYTSNKISTIVYTTDIGTITETVSYSGDTVTSITLSGDTPSGISLTKTFNYTGTNISSFTYA